MIEDHARNISVPPRFCSTKLIEGDEYFADKLELDKNERELIEHSVVEMEHDTGLDRNAALADMRYTFIEKAVSSRWLSAVKAVNINLKRENRLKYSRENTRRCRCFSA